MLEKRDKIERVYGVSYDGTIIDEYYAWIEKITCPTGKLKYIA